MDDRAPEAPLLRTTEDGVAVLTLHRPRQFNALSADLLHALQAQLDAIAHDRAIRVVLVTGAGSAFCSGHDLKEMRALGSREAVQELFQRCSAMMARITALPQPVVAVVNGMATAAGCQLVAQCDLAIASEHARFGTSGVNLGLFCSTPAVALSRTISRKRAAEMLFTGDFIDAATALDWGLVNRVVPAGQLMESARALAATLKSKPPEALAAGKALFYRQLELTMAQAYADASCVIATNMDTEVAREGVDAFFAKRSPRWE